MREIRPPGRIKLIIGLLSRDSELFKNARVLLESLYGRVDFESEIINFTHTTYYNEELGDSLKRKFLSFEKSPGLENIYKIKLKTNLLEGRFAHHGRRRINIDPGYLDLSKLVLFSTKDYSHRVHLAKGIFAEVTLYYKNKTYNPWPWTYPDYGTRAYIDIFNTIRKLV